MKSDAILNMKRQMGWVHKVYVLTFPDGKKYVGQTELDVTKRWRGGLGYKDNREMFDAIVWYGWKNIEKEVVAEGLSAMQADYIERITIDKLCTCDFDIGFNRRRGQQTEGVDFFLMGPMYDDVHSIGVQIVVDEESYMKISRSHSVSGDMSVFGKENVDDFIFALKDTEYISSDCYNLGGVVEELCAQCPESGFEKGLQMRNVFEDMGR